MAWVLSRIDNGGDQFAAGADLELIASEDDGPPKFNLTSVFSPQYYSSRGKALAFGLLGCEVVVRLENLRTAERYVESQGALQVNAPRVVDVQSTYYRGGSGLSVDLGFQAGSEAAVPMMPSMALKMGQKQPDFVQEKKQFEQVSKTFDRVVIESGRGIRGTYWMAEGYADICLRGQHSFWFGAESDDAASNAFISVEIIASKKQLRVMTDKNSHRLGREPIWASFVRAAAIEKVFGARGGPSAGGTVFSGRWRLAHV